MIILEGPDNSGKTTLAKKILSAYGGKLEYGPWSGPSVPQSVRDSLRDTEKPRIYGGLVRSVLGQDLPLLHDRFFFSGLVYGEVLRQDVRWTWPEQRFICRVLTAISPPIIFCMPPLDEVTKNLYGRHQLAGVTDNTEKIYKAYSALSHLRRPRVTLYDWTRGPAADQRVMGIIGRYLERREARAWQE